MCRPVAVVKKPGRCPRQRIPAEDHDCTCDALLWTREQTRCRSCRSCTYPPALCFPLPNYMYLTHVSYESATTGRSTSLGLQYHRRGPAVIGTQPHSKCHHTQNAIIPRRQHGISVFSPPPPPPASTPYPVPREIIHVCLGRVPIWDLGDRRRSFHQNFHHPNLELVRGCYSIARSRPRCECILLSRILLTGIKFETRLGGGGHKCEATRDVNMRKVPSTTV